MSPSRLCTFEGSEGGTLDSQGAGGGEEGRRAFRSGKVLGRRWGLSRRDRVWSTGLAACRPLRIGGRETGSLGRAEDENGEACLENWMLRTIGGRQHGILLSGAYAMRIPSTSKWAMPRCPGPPWTFLIGGAARPAEHETMELHPCSKRHKSLVLMRGWWVWQIRTLRGAKCAGAGPGRGCLMSRRR